MDYYKITQDGMRIRDLDIMHTVESAQPLTFQADYDFSKGQLSYTSSNTLIKGKFEGGGESCTVRFDSTTAAYASKDFVKRFRLADDMKDIYSHISTDKLISAAVEKYLGMRVTLTDPWETTLCFIISQYNNVKRIRMITKRFIEEFGEEIVGPNGKVIAKAFPTSERLTNFSENDFRRCGAGFRAKYITKASEFCTNNLDLHKLKSKSYDDVKSTLMEISGVGDKVSDCIALMGYGKMEAFPIDVWVKRTLEKAYFKGKEKKIAQLHQFAEDNWGKYRGYAQQYLFHYARNNNF